MIFLQQLLFLDYFLTKITLAVTFADLLAGKQFGLRLFLSVILCEASSVIDWRRKCESRITWLLGYTVYPYIWDTCLASHCNW